MTEVEVVILRFSLGICNPGCLHLVLESVSPKPPYLLENRTGHPFQYRQAGIGEQCMPYIQEETERQQEEEQNMQKPEEHKHKQEKQKEAQALAPSCKHDWASTAETRKVAM